MAIYFDHVLGQVHLSEPVKKFDKNHDKLGRFASTSSLSVNSVTGAEAIPTSQEGAKWVNTHQDPMHTGSNWAGSPKNPIECGDDIDKAAKLIASGLNVTLNQPDEVSTLVGKIQQQYKDAKAKGEKPPMWNIADISVKGTNLFAVENIGVPRVSMPQFAGRVDAGSKAATLLPKGADLSKDEVDLTQEFIKSLKTQGIGSSVVTFPASHFRSSQDELDGAKVGGIEAAMEAGTLPPGMITVTRDNYIVDGHHRWAATMIQDMKNNRLGDILMTVNKLDIDIGTALTLGKAFQKKWGISEAKVGKELSLGWILKARG